MAGAKQVSISVDGKIIDVWVVQTGKVTYRAYADFRNRPIEATGVSEKSAIDAWRSKANYAANE